jgi:hypothetical protein
MNRDAYVLGTSADEARRLELQAAILGGPPACHRAQSACPLAEEVHSHQP